MANYPKYTGIERIDFWANELTRELDTRDRDVDNRPATRIYTVVSVSEIGRPLSGDIAFAASAGKFRGYVSGTGWVDFN